MNTETSAAPRERRAWTSGPFVVLLFVVFAAVAVTVSITRGWTLHDVQEVQQGGQRKSGRESRGRPALAALSRGAANALFDLFTSESFDQSARGDLNFLRNHPEDVVLVKTMWDTERDTPAGDLRSNSDAGVVILGDTGVLWTTSVDAEGESIAQTIGVMRNGDGGASAMSDDVAFVKIHAALIGSRVYNPRR